MKGFRYSSEAFLEEKMGNKLNKKAYPLYLLVPAVVVYSVFIIIPFLFSIFFSLTDWNIERMFTPVFRGVTNYLTVLQDKIFVRAVVNTLLFAVGTTILKIAFGLLLALAVLKVSRLNNVLRTIFYIPCVMSPLIIGVIFTSILADQGLLNNLLESLGLSALAVNWLAKYATAMSSVIMIEGWMWSGFNMFIFIAGLQAISTDYYESADVDGVSKFNQFRYITLPLLVPSFTVTVTLNITGSLKVFDLIYVLTQGGPGFDTQVMSTYVYRSFGLGLLGESSAASVILAVIVVLISFVLNRYLTRKEVAL